MHRHQVGICVRFLCASLLVGLSGPETAAAATPAMSFGEAQSLGNGDVRTFVSSGSDGKISAVGVVFGAGLLEGLPERNNNTGRCFDLDEDGQFDADHECMGDYERVLAFPTGLLERLNTPLRWVGLNWNPRGHAAPAPPPWAAPHFDFHFYIATIDEVQAIRPGKCGELIDCEDFERATLPLPEKYVPQDHIDVGAAVPAMGNHLIDKNSPELLDPDVPFTHTFIYGAYDGRITFLEPMITREFLLSRPNMCAPIKAPRAWAVGGYYPTEYCIRYADDERSHAVSLEKFVLRAAE